MKDKIPILDAEYFERKRKKELYERRRQSITRYSPNPFGDEEMLKYSINNVAEQYFNTVTMTAEDFERKVEGKLKLYSGKGMLCPVTNFSSTNTKISKKKPMTVGDVFSIPVSFVGATLGCLIYLVLHMTGVM